MPKTQSRSSNAARVTWVLVAVFGVALLSSVIGAYSLTQKTRSKAGPKTQLTLQRGARLHKETLLWQRRHGLGQCPSLAALRQASDLRISDTLDGWGRAFHINCTKGKVARPTILSLGADGVKGPVAGVSDDLDATPR